MRKVQVCWMQGNTLNLTFHSAGTTPTTKRHIPLFVSFAAIINFFMVCVCNETESWGQCTTDANDVVQLREHANEWSYWMSDCMPGKSFPPKYQKLGLSLCCAGWLTGWLLVHALVGRHPTIRIVKQFLIQLITSQSLLEAHSCNISIISCYNDTSSSGITIVASTYNNTTSNSIKMLHQQQLQTPAFISKCFNLEMHLRWMEIYHATPSQPPWT